MRVFQQERAIYKTTELIESVMQEKNINRSELARRLGKSKGWVTQLLDQDANKTICTIADVLAVMGREYHAFSWDICISNAPAYSGQLEVPWTEDDDDSEALATIPFATRRITASVGALAR